MSDQSFARDESDHGAKTQEDLTVGNRPLVSVIVPVYNGEKHLRKEQMERTNLSNK